MGLMMNVPDKGLYCRDDQRGDFVRPIKPGDRTGTGSTCRAAWCIEDANPGSIAEFSAGGLCGQTSQPAYAGSGIRQRTDPRCISYD